MWRTTPMMSTLGARPSVNPVAVPWLVVSSSWLCCWPQERLGEHSAVPASTRVASLQRVGVAVVDVLLERNDREQRKVPFELGKWRGCVPRMH